MSFEELQKRMSPDRWVVFQLKELQKQQEFSKTYWDRTMNQEVYTPVTDRNNLIQLKAEKNFFIIIYNNI